MLHRRNLTNPPTYFSGGGPLRKPILEFAMVISVVTLCFFAVDNYRVRTSLTQELQSQQLKAREQQEFFARQVSAARKKRELQVLNERKLHQVREMKLALHIAMLRRQLQDADKKPVSVQDVLQEYHNSVKMENSISDVSGTFLWLQSSELNAFLPNVREYNERDR
ncbi:hypothetical protein ZYGR_0AI02450 [Zygosaccharomyces rouxii]|uniref:Uncharacterized protein n=1 Tax=Zygosaccharomyces rouxii TaxID=4956 RepID=A0A1Q3ABQ2_ZYGRO|nr:hypothetical protein ZYGR_0AI02450 [Zygosaccharomyces rouxii]